MFEMTAICAENRIQTVWFSFVW